MISLTQMAYGSAERRQGRSRRFVVKYATTAAAMLLADGSIIVARYDVAPVRPSVNEWIRRSRATSRLTSAHIAHIDSLRAVLDNFFKLRFGTLTRRGRR